MVLIVDININFQEILGSPGEDGDAGTSELYGVQLNFSNNI